MTQPVAYLSMPSYGAVAAGAARGFYRSTRGGLEVHLNYDQGSLLACNFNVHWCWALQSAWQGKRVDYFAMLHADVSVEDFWLDRLVEELERNSLDVLSVVIPIKDMHGLTSTALAKEGSDPFALEGRLTMREVRRLPDTFTAADLGRPDDVLLVNTGCWVCRFDPAWASRFCFTINDRISFDLEKGYKVDVEPEDWNASRQWHALGLHVGATCLISARHRGEVDFANTHVWGDWTVDREYRTESLVPPRVIPDAPEGWRFPDDVNGWLSEAEGAALAQLAAGKQALEIGSYCGLSTICMAQTAQEVVAVDPFDGRGTPLPRDTFAEFSANLKRYGVAVRAHRGTINEVGPCLEPSFDLVFIDGAHDVDSVRNDIGWARRLLRPEGLVAFHDYGRLGDEGVTEAVEEFLSGGAQLLGVHDHLAVCKP